MPKEKGSEYIFPRDQPDEDRPEVRKQWIRAIGRPTELSES